MKFGWETREQKILRMAKVSAKKKLEAIRLMNEMADKVLTSRQKLVRRKLKEAKRI